MMLRTLLGLATAVTAMPLATPDPLSLLASETALTRAERADFGAGRPVARVVDTTDRAEVMSVAAVRVQASAERFLACARDVSCLHRNDDALQAGRLGDRPEATDLAALGLDKRDTDALAHCQVGRCELRLSAEAIARLRKDVDWLSAAAPSQATAVFRSVLLEAAARYAEQGNRGLMGYHDDDRPVWIADSVNSLLARRFFLFDLAPELRRHLVEYPASMLDTADDYFCWYREKFWRKTVIALTHVTVYEKAATPAPIVLVSSKQLYATHYYESELDLLAYISDAKGPHGALVFLSRARADIRPSGFNWMERLLLRRLVRGRLENQLRLMKSRLEQYPRPPSTSP